MEKKENNRQYKLVDQMISMHANLRDEYNNKALLLNLGLLAASVFLCAFVFADDQILSLFSADPKLLKIGLGLSSVLCFVLSLVEYRVDWKGKAALHADAATKLAILKAEFRESLIKHNGNDQNEISRLSCLYNETMKDIVEIPENKFSKLKAKHLYKVSLSKMISTYPEAPVILLRARLRFSGIKQALLDSKDKG